MLSYVSFTARVQLLHSLKAATLCNGSVGHTMAEAWQLLYCCTCFLFMLARGSTVPCICALQVLSVHGHAFMLWMVLH
jgi:hypothetical protein